MSEKNFYSQFGEDRLLAQVFAGMDDGLCVEVGANDGINDSNTLYFEQLGWGCILVEPNPDLCSQIRRHRNGRLFECAVSSRGGSAVLNIAEGPARAHGVSALGEPSSASRRIASFGFDSRPVRVVTRTLDDILQEANIDKPLRLVSIDVEGHELDVLQAFSLDKWRPTIVLVEDNSNFEDGAVRAHLCRFGSVPFMRTGVNDWYAHRSNTELADARSTMAWRWASLSARIRSRLRRIPGLKAFVRWLRGAK